ncbi:MAG: DUF2961 domain-containing protein [Clostridia bacterium]|nr:DUF2961 domain-containing protein [Clostridia bacterium]
MFNNFNMMSNLTRITNYESRSISAENFTGEKGKGGMATEGTGSIPSRDLGQGWKVSPSVIIPAGKTFELCNIEDEAVIKHIWVTHSCPMNRRLIFRIYWDDCEYPSVEAPLGDFFACADSMSFSPLSSIPVCVNPGKAFNCYWEMPFKKRCRMTIENIYTEDVVVYYQIDYTLCPVPDDFGYFHAQYRRTNPLPYKENYVLLDNVQGDGHYVGTYMFWGVNNTGWWGEGEIKFYLDGDTDFPTICGTGTEDYFLGAYNFDVAGKYTEYCTPFAGLAKVIRPDGTYRSQTRFSLYRWHILDPIYFHKDIKVTIQALGWRHGRKYLPLQDDISSVSFWYMKKQCTTFPEFPCADDLEII